MGDPVYQFKKHMHIGPSLPIGLRNRAIQSKIFGDVLVTSPTNKGVVVIRRDALFELNESMNWIKLEQNLEFGRKFHLAILIPDELTYEKKIVNNNQNIEEYVMEDHLKKDQVKEDLVTGAHVKNVTEVHVTDDNVTQDYVKEDYVTEDHEQSQELCYYDKLYRGQSQASKQLDQIHFCTINCTFVDFIF